MTRLLDIGCDNRKIKGGSGVEVIGIDIDSDCDADLVMDAHNLTFEEGYFDIVHIHQVIEHCDHPVIVLCGIERVLKDEGVLWLSIPNLRKLMRLFFYLRGKRIHQTKGHIYAWDEDTLYQFIERCHFKIVGKWYVDDDHREQSRFFANRYLIKCVKDSVFVSLKNPQD